MEAVISGRAGVAFLVDGDRYDSIHADELPERMIPRSAAELRLLLLDAGDLESLEDIDPVAAASRLVIAREQAQALELTLILIDPVLSRELRCRAAAELDTLLSASANREHVQKLLYARPMDPSADLEGALALIENRLERITSFIRELVGIQPTVARVRTSWESIPAELFEHSQVVRREIESAFIRSGIARSLVLYLKREEMGDVSADFDVVASDQSVEGIGNARQILEAWLKSVHATAPQDESVRAEQSVKSIVSPQEKADLRAVTVELSPVASGTRREYAWRFSSARRRLRGTAERPRLAVFRSSKHIYAQLVNDDEGKTLAAASTSESFFRRQAAPGSNKAAAAVIGRLLAERAKALGITTVCFDRRSYKFHGSVKMLADAARDAGLELASPRIRLVRPSKFDRNSSRGRRSQKNQS